MRLNDGEPNPVSGAVAYGPLTPVSFPGLWRMPGGDCGELDRLNYNYSIHSIVGLVG